MCDRIIWFHVLMICLAGAIGVNPARSASSEGDEGAGPRPGPTRPTDPFPLDLAFSRRGTFSDYEKAAISPNGRYVAYGVVTPSRRRNDISTLPSGLPVWMLGTRLNLTDLTNGQTIVLGAEGSNNFSPAWSPDGSKLAYYSDEGGILRAWTFDVAKGKGRLAADVRVKVHIYSSTAMPPTWSPDGRELLVPALPADEANADPRPPFGMPKSKKGRTEPWRGVLVMASGAEPVPPVETEIATFSHYGAVVDMTAIDIGEGTTRILLPARPADRGRRLPSTLPVADSSPTCPIFDRDRPGWPTMRRTSA